MTAEKETDVEARKRLRWARFYAAAGPWLVLALLFCAVVGAYHAEGSTVGIVFAVAGGVSAAVFAAVGTVAARREATGSAKTSL